ncbi:sulfite mitochondrial isoform X2 [Brachionus plicatilis]|uniref:Sulfite mitochondrial isoform X2 n=1 Tax=Brachionus plicatilis TaxID=10195 RepID=A0A3M7S240_BRAPC|nr:sulfite mitochondrial isoform X2 [Brachionus plicatilis]
MTYEFKFRKRRLGYYSYKNSAVCEEKAHSDEKSFEWGKIIDNLPFYTEDDVKEHKTKDKGIWVSYRNGVYDITEFVDGHPGKN